MFQSRQSIAVQDPEKLASHLQVLTGSHAFLLLLADVNKAIEQLQMRHEDLIEESARWACAFMKMPTRTI